MAGVVLCSPVEPTLKQTLDIQFVWLILNDLKVNCISVYPTKWELLFTPQRHTAHTLYPCSHTQTLIHSLRLKGNQNQNPMNNKHEWIINTFSPTGEAVRVTLFCCSELWTSLDRRFSSKMMVMMKSLKRPLVVWVGANRKTTPDSTSASEGGDMRLINVSRTDKRASGCIWRGDSWRW